MPNGKNSMKKEIISYSRLYNIECHGYDRALISRTQWKNVCSGNGNGYSSISIFIITLVSVSIAIAIVVVVAAVFVLVFWPFRILWFKRKHKILPCIVCSCFGTIGRLLFRIFIVSHPINLSILLTPLLFPTNYVLCESFKPFFLCIRIFIYMICPCPLLSYNPHELDRYKHC